VLDALAQLRQVPVHQDEAALVAPERFSEKHVVAAQDILDYTFVTVIRLVPSTQEYKVLRVLEDSCSSSPEQLYKIFTIDGSSHTRCLAGGVRRHLQLLFQRATGKVSLIRSNVCNVSNVT
jgi:hypothetical protein